MESIFRELDWEKYGIIVNGTSINNLRFADDIILIARSINELKKMGEELFKKSAEIGLQASRIKTKYMSNNPDTELNIEGTNIEKVEDYSYLGRIVSFNKRYGKGDCCKEREGMEELLGAERGI